MSSLNRVVVSAVAVLSLALMVGCGSSSNGAVTNTAPPTGSFGVASLNGTYVFSISGTDSGNGPYAIAGTFTANGQGAITGGAVDVNDPDISATPVANSALASSSYKVGVDGRGQVELATPISSLGTVVLDFVLQDASHGLVTEFDQKATGSGTFDLQSSGVAPTGSYAFSLSGSDFTSGTADMFATVGNFTIGANNAFSGLEDVNDNTIAYSNEALSGTLVLGPSSTPATVLTIANFRQLTFDVFAIDSTHLKFIEMDATSNLVGDAFTQTNTIPAGTFAFTLQGSYPGATTASAAGGFIVTDGNGNVTSSSTLDTNNGGTVSPTPSPTFSGSYAAAGTGRYTLSLSPFDGTAYAAYPSSGGIFLLEIDDGGIMTGAAFQQSATTFAAGQGYGLNFSGANLADSVEVDEIAEFTANSSGATVTGAVDENFQPGNSSPIYSLALSGTYIAPTNGRGSITATAGNSSNSTLNGGFVITFYTVDGTSFPFIETDQGGGQITAGVFVQQSPTSSAAAMRANSHLFVPAPMVHSKAALKKRG